MLTVNSALSLRFFACSPPIIFYGTFHKVTFKGGDVLLLIAASSKDGNVEGPVKTFTLK